MLNKDYDYFDFGCSEGGNMRYVQAIDPGLRGFGIDIDESKLVKARANGFEGINQDILQLPSEKLVRFVTMSQFLEHLPSVRVAEAMIRKGIEVSREFVLIRQPWFDSDGYLMQQGLKCFWSDWSGHPNRMVSLDFFLILSRALQAGSIAGFDLFGHVPIVDGNNPCLIPIQSPRNQHHYNGHTHGPKRMDLVFPVPVYREVVAVVRVDANAEVEPFVRPLAELVPLLPAA